MQISPYIRLMRLHQPVGIWLLMWPCWWALALASGGLPPLRLLILFAIGALLMRAAGCIVNDLADRRFDAQVERTQSRPLASGELKPIQAIFLLAILLALALCVAIMLGKSVVLWSLLALPPVAIYPLMKRISWWPQLFLGLTFNWGALVGWAAVRHEIALPALLLYAGCIFWTLGYDTIYAHQDKADDAKIGLKSTALRLGNKSKTAIRVFYALAASFWMLAALATGHVSPVTYGLLAFAFVHLQWQALSVDLDAPDSCRKTFFSNAWLGAVPFAAFILSH